MRTLLFLALTLIASFSVVGCALIGPHQRPLHQGHQFDAEQLAQLRVGQSSAEVRQLLGTPLLPVERQAEQLTLTYPLDAGDRDIRLLQLTFVSDQLQPFELPVLPD